MINIGDRVAYDDNVSGFDHGTVVEPTDEEKRLAAAWEYPTGPEFLVIEWDDGDRSWEDPDGLVVVQGAGS